MIFTEEELQLIETSLRGTLERKGGEDTDIEQLIEMIVKQNMKNDKSN